MCCWCNTCKDGMATRKKTWPISCHYPTISNVCLKTATIQVFCSMSCKLSPTLACAIDSNSSVHGQHVALIPLSVVEKVTALSLRPMSKLDEILQRATAHELRPDWHGERMWKGFCDRICFMVMFTRLTPLDSLHAQKISRDYHLFMSFGNLVLGNVIGPLESNHRDGKIYNNISKEQTICQADTSIWNNEWKQAFIYRNKSVDLTSRNSQAAKTKLQTTKTNRSVGRPQGESYELEFLQSEIQTLWRKIKHPSLQTGSRSQWHWSNCWVWPRSLQWIFPSCAAASWMLSTTGCHGQKQQQPGTMVQKCWKHTLLWLSKELTRIVGTLRKEIHWKAAILLK